MMTERTAFNDYFQGPQRSVIQVERKERGDWIVWNWRTISWDSKPYKLSADGVSENGK